MAYDEYLADRVRASLSRRAIPFDERRMMGGLCFMVAGKMCLGIVDSRLMVRLDPDVYDSALRKPGCAPMDFTGRPMRGFVFVQPEGHETNSQFESWVQLALEFNPRAKSSKTKYAAERSAGPLPRARKPGKRKKQG